MKCVEEPITGEYKYKGVIVDVRLVCRGIQHVVLLLTSCQDDRQQSYDDEQSLHFFSPILI